MPFLRFGYFLRKSAETDFFTELSTHAMLFKKPKKIRNQNASVNQSWEWAHIYTCVFWEQMFTGIM